MLLREDAIEWLVELHVGLDDPRDSCRGLGVLNRLAGSID